MNDGVIHWVVELVECILSDWLYRHGLSSTKLNKDLHATILQAPRVFDFHVTSPSRAVLLRGVWLSLFWLRQFRTALHSMCQR
jgi:hypothetical protein